MEWLWALIALLMSWTIFWIARHFWQAPAKWRQQGHVSNGLGYTIYADKNRRSFEIVAGGTRFWAGFGFAFSVAVFVVGIVWLARAISE